MSCFLQPARGGRNRSRNLRHRVETHKSMVPNTRMSAAGFCVLVTGYLNLSPQQRAETTEDLAERGGWRVARLGRSRVRRAGAPIAVGDRGW